MALKPKTATKASAAKAPAMCLKGSTPNSAQVYGKPEPGSPAASHLFENVARY